MSWRVAGSIPVLTVRAVDHDDPYGYPLPAPQPILEFREPSVDAVRYDAFLASLPTTEREKRLGRERK